MTGSVVRVRLREDMPSTLILLGGQSYRVGQIGAFFRIPLGYASLYAVCTQVGADAAPNRDEERSEGGALEEERDDRLAGYRWMAMVLFGERIGGNFERGVGQYPTVGDEVHLVTNDELTVMYGSSRDRTGSISVGHIAMASGIPADIGVAELVSRHSVAVGSTGAGKSNLVTVLLEGICDGTLPNARTIVIDPHGEYATALGEKARVFSAHPKPGTSEQQLRVPYWALPLSELLELTLGGVQQQHEAAIRELVLEMKLEAAKALESTPPDGALTADSPIPFSLKRLWYELDLFERITFPEASKQDPSSAYGPLDAGDAETLRPAQFPPASSYNTAPFRNQRKRNIERKLDFMRSRLRDSRFSFLFDPGYGYSPTFDGCIERDLDALVGEWVGGSEAVSILDMSGVPSEMLPTTVGTVLRVVYDMLFWGQNLPVGGREQPLLVVLDEAHRFVPEGMESAAQRTLSIIAKEGRKYGVGLMLVTQRPSEIDGGILSQCGSLIALRLTNSLDRSKVGAAVPDDLGGLVEQLPSLRTGEGIFLGELVPIPSRVRVRKATRKPDGDDPKLPDVWQTVDRPDVGLYEEALRNWRVQSTAGDGYDVNNGSDDDA